MTPSGEYKTPSFPESDAPSNIHLATSCPIYGLSKLFALCTTNMKRSASMSPDLDPISSPASSTSSPSKKTKSSPSTPSKKASGSHAFPTSAKIKLLEVAMEVAARSMPFKELSDELGISESRLKDQFKPGRSNLRKQVSEIYGKSD